MNERERELQAWLVDTLRDSADKVEQNGGELLWSSVKDTEDARYKRVELTYLVVKEGA